MELTFAAKALRDVYHTAVNAFSFGLHDYIAVIDDVRAELARRAANTPGMHPYIEYLPVEGNEFLRLKIGARDTTNPDAVTEEPKTIIISPVLPGTGPYVPTRYMVTITRPSGPNVYSGTYMDSMRMMWTTYRELFYLTDKHGDNIAAHPLKDLFVQLRDQQQPSSLLGRVKHAYRHYQNLASELTF